MNDTGNASFEDRAVDLSTPAKRWRHTGVKVVLLSGPCFLTLVFTVLPPVLHGVAEHFGGGAAGQLAAQLVMILPSVGLMLGGPLIGWLIDRLGARGVMLVSLTAYGLLGSAGTFIDAKWTLLATRFALGFAASGIVTSTMTMIGERFGPAQRARLLGYSTFCGAASGLLSLLLSGSLAEAGDWHAPFAMYLLAFCMMPLVMVCLPAQPVKPRNRETVSTGALGQLTAIFPIYGATAMIYVAAFMTNAQVSFLLATNGITSPVLQSRVIGVASLTTAIGGAMYGAFHRRIGGEWIFCVILAALGCGITVIGLSHTAIMVAIGCGLSGLGGGMLFPHMLNRVLERAHANVRSRAVGLQYSAVFFGDFLNPFILAPITLIAGIHGAFMFIGSVLAAAALFAALRR